MRPRKKVKLADIAKMSGVSIVTVSNALAGRGGVSEDVRARIMACAEELGYRKEESERKPAKENLYISVLFSGDRTVLTEESDPFLACLRKAAAKQSVTLSTGVLKNREDGQVPEICWTSDRGGIVRIDGLLVYGGLPEESLRNLIDFFKIPVVGYGFMHSGVDIDYIMDDGLRGMRRAVRHLAELGHRDIMYVSEEIGENRMLMDRLLGFWYAMYEYKLIDPMKILEKIRRCEAGLDALGERIRAGQLPDAVVCSSDETAEAVRRMLLSEGVRVPEDISLTGYRYQGAKEGTFMSSCVIPLDVHAEKCLALLRKRISKGGESDGVRLIACDFVSGGSSGAHAELTGR